jgi:hypothetical protein
MTWKRCSWTRCCWKTLFPLQRYTWSELPWKVLFFSLAKRNPETNWCRNVHALPEDNSITHCLGAGMCVFYLWAQCASCKQKNPNRTIGQKLPFLHAWSSCNICPPFICWKWSLPKTFCRGRVMSWLSYSFHQSAWCLPYTPIVKIIRACRPSWPIECVFQILKWSHVPL